MSTPDFTNFNQREFIKEIRAFLKKHGVSVRRFAKLTDTAPMALYRPENDMRVGTVIHFQKFMKTFKPRDDA